MLKYFIFAPMVEVARSAEGELISSKSHPTGMSKLTSSLRNSILPIQGGKPTVGSAGVNNIAQADENNNSMSLRGANATWQSTTNKKILKQVRNDNKQVRNDKDYTLSLVGEGRVRYEQDAVQHHTSSAYGIFSYSLGEGNYIQNDNKKVLKSLSNSNAI